VKEDLEEKKTVTVPVSDDSIMSIPPTLVPSDSSGLILSELEIDEVQAWSIPHVEAWRARIREDAIFGPILRFLTKPTVDDMKQVRMKNIVRNFAAVDGLLITRRLHKQTLADTLFLLVPNGLRVVMISEIHDTDHRGVENTLEGLRLSQKWWPGITQDVSLYVKACIFCALLKAQGTGKGLQVGWGIEPRKFSCIHIDFTGPLRPTAAGYRWILSFIDRMSGWAEMTPVVRCTSEEAIKMMVKTWIPRYGVPRVAVSDNGTHFTSHQIKEAAESLG